MSVSLTDPVLVLNRNYQPVRVTTAQHAFSMLYVGRACALDASFEPLDFEEWISCAPGADDETLGTSSGPLRVPRILLLVRYNRVPKTTVRLSRRNVFLRDDYTCQYCARRLPVRDLNLDHVMPRSRGGPATWENLVTACRECNGRKGRATPDECGMRLRSRPGPPAWSSVFQMVGTVRCPEWEVFLSSLRPASASD